MGYETVYSSQYRNQDDTSHVVMNIWGHPAERALSAMRKHGG